ncbi:MAG: sterol desaturase family protein [Pseudomonadales bacterium]|nr:sterol desaturase family protein [Pseudomonadales bacterium]
MDEFLTSHQTAIRLSFFLTLFCVVALVELQRPKRMLTVSKGKRWLNNLGVTVLNSVMMRLVFPTTAVGVAVLAESNGWGVFNYFQFQSLWALILAVIILDFVIYLQHVLFHFVPLLWRVHGVHHADLDYDVTTGARFHPVEIILSMLIKVVVILSMGPSASAVILFEMLLNATAMFNHGNIDLPKKVDGILRLFVVTPDMHRVHHSVEVNETNSNFGFNLPWWDRFFGTYIPSPNAGHKDMVIGLPDFRDEKQTNRLFGLLLLPFQGLNAKSQ